MKTYTNSIIQRNYLSFINQTNNLVYYAADSIPLDHQKRKIPSELKRALGLKEEIANFYDYQIETGFGFSKLQFLAIISVCADTEFLFKDLSENHFQLTAKRQNAYFQKIDQVNTDIFIPKNIDLRDYPEFDRLKLGFQLRHIAIHNMGYVDEAFNNKIGLSYEVDKPFPMSRELMVETLKAFEGLLDTLDQLL